jgi:hypothetical protein
MRGIAGIWNALIDSFRKTKPTAAAPKTGNRRHTVPPWENHLVSEKSRLFDESNVREGRPGTVQTGFSWS